MQQMEQGEKGGQQESAELDIYGYAEPINLTSMMMEDSLSVTDASYTLEDNPYVNLYKEHGMNVTYKLSGMSGDVSTKLDMAITTGDIPDIMQVSATQFRELSEAGLLADLSEAYETYASEELRARVEADGGLMMQNGYVDGQLLCLAPASGYHDYIGVVALRSDWMEECGLTEPTTMDELWKIAETFKEKNMDGTCTIGMSMTKDVTTLLRPTINLLNAYHAYVNIWLEKDGEVVNSVIQPELKEALGILADKYAAGLIDPEFGSKGYDEMCEDAIAGRTGVVVADFCIPFRLVNGVTNGQEWVYYAVPSNDGQVVKFQESVAFNGGVAVSADCEHPEAVIKMMNLFVKYSVEDMETYGSNGVNNYAYPTNIGAPNANEKTYAYYMEALQASPDDVITHVTEAGGDGNVVSSVEAAEKWRVDGDTDGYIMWAVFGENSTEAYVTEAVEKDAFQVSVYTGSTTDTMETYNATLNTMIEQMITNIITGTKPIEYFDEFVSNWKANGGDRITEEVNEWYRQQSAN